MDDLTLQETRQQAASIPAYNRAARRSRAGLWLPAHTVGLNLHGWRWWKHALEQLKQGGLSSDIGRFEFGNCRLEHGTPCQIGAQQ